jgi:hypothetical protein
METGQDRCEWHDSGTPSEATRYRLAPLAPTLTVGRGPSQVPNDSWTSRVRGAADSEGGQQARCSCRMRGLTSQVDKEAEES